MSAPSSYVRPPAVPDGPPAPTDYDTDALPCEEPADAELDRVTFDALRVVVGWFAALMVPFALIDPFYVEPADRVMVAAATVAVAVVFAVVAAWLRFSPPPARWAHPIAFGVSAVGQLRLLSLLAADPGPFQVLNLSVLIVGTGCVQLSPRWFAATVGFAAAAWWTTALALGDVRGPMRAAWVQAGFVTVGMTAVAAVVLTIRRRSHLALAEARLSDERRKGEDLARLRISQTLATITARIQQKQGDEFDAAVDASLADLIHLLNSDHAYLTRLDDPPARLTVTHESVARGRPSRMPHLQNVLLDSVPYFRRRLSTGEPIHVPDIDSLPPEAAAEKAVLRSLGSRAYLAVPVRADGAVWGYVGLVDDATPRHWSSEEINLVRVVGDVIVTALTRRAADEARRESEARFRALYESNIVGVMFADIAGRIVQANDAFLNPLGYDRTDLPLRWDLLTPPEWQAENEAAVERIRATGVDLPWEKEFFRKDGSRMPILIGGALLSAETGSCLAFAIDLTERKAAEETIRRLSKDVERIARLGTMGEITAGIAHEVRQPLGAIANYANGLRRRLERGPVASAELITRLGDIAAQCERASAVVERIREFVKDRKPVAGSVDLNAAVRECLTLAKLEVREAGVTVETALDPAARHAWTDQVRLSQVLLNLILNAVQAMAANAGPRRLRIATRVDGDCVEATVADTGPGVAAADRPRLFDQFFTTKPDGLGLGLSLARSLAESHGGSLTLADTGPPGATFVLRLPSAEGRPRPC